MDAATTRWDRHAILAEIKRRFGTAAELARVTGRATAAQISLALGQPYEPGERAIAEALGVPVQELWPDRYWPNGRPRRTPSRARHGGASQITAPNADTGGTA